MEPTVSLLAYFEHYGPDWWVETIGAERTLKHGTEIAARSGGPRVLVDRTCWTMHLYLSPVYLSRFLFLLPNEDLGRHILKSCRFVNLNPPR